MKKFFILPMMVLMSLTYSCSSSDDSITENTGTENNGGGTKPKPSVVMKDKANYRPIDEAQQQYYKGIDFTLRGEKLKEALHALLVKTHKVLSYTPEVREAARITDEDPDNSDNLLVIYGWAKGDESSTIEKRTIKKNDYYISKDQRYRTWEREHVFAQSLSNPKMAANNSTGFKPTNENDLPAHDVHHIRAINGQMNSDRNNFKFTEGSGNASYKGNYTWYPGDEWKGDVARMMMYMYVRYGDQCNPGLVGVGNQVGTPDYGGYGMLRLFLKWNAEDPVTQIERNRNIYHGNSSNRYSQGNRNPFIDNPYLANLIWWGGQDQEELVADNIWERVE